MSVKTAGNKKKYTEEELETFFASCGFKRKFFTEETMRGYAIMKDPQEAIDDYREHRNEDPNFWIMKQSAYMIGREDEQSDI